MKNQSTTKGFAILSITGLICKILALIYVPIQTAIVGDYGNNIISSGYRIYVFMFSLSNLGIPVNISKMIAEQNAVGNYKGSKKIFRLSLAFIMVISVIFAVLLAFGSKWIANEIRQPEAYLMFLTLSPVFIFTGINCALRGYFQGRKNMVPTAVSQVIEQVLNSFLTVTLIYILFNATKTNVFEKFTNAAAGSAVGTLSGAIGAGVFLIIVFLLIKKQRKSEEQLQDYKGQELTNTYVMKQLIKYSIPSLIATIGTSAADLIDATNCVRRMLEGGMNEQLAKVLNGQYTTAYQRTLSLSIFVVAALVAALVPAISTAASQKDKKQLTHKINESFKALFLFMIPCLVGFTLLSKPIISFIFFNVEQGGFKFLTYWGWSNILFGIIAIQSAILLGIGKPVIAPLSLIFGMVFKLIINYYLVSIPEINMNGAAIGTIVGWSISLFINHYAINKALKDKIHYFRLAFKPLACSLGMGAVAFLTYYGVHFVLKLFIGPLLLVNDISLIVAIILGAFIYMALLLKTKTLSLVEIHNLPLGNKIGSFIKKIPILKNY